MQPTRMTKLTATTAPIPQLTSYTPSRARLVKECSRGVSAQRHKLHQRDTPSSPSLVMRKAFATRTALFIRGSPSESEDESRTNLLRVRSWARLKVTESVSSGVVTLCIFSLLKAKLLDDIAEDCVHVAIKLCGAFCGLNKMHEFSIDGI